MVGGYTNTHKRLLPELHQFLKHELLQNYCYFHPNPTGWYYTPEGDSHIKLMGMLLVSLRHRICRFWSPLRVLHTWKDRKPINVSLWVVSNKIIIPIKMCCGLRWVSFKTCTTPRLVFSTGLILIFQQASPSCLYGTEPSGVEGSLATPSSKLLVQSTLQTP